MTTVLMSSKSFRTDKAVVYRFERNISRLYRCRVFNIASRTECFDSFHDTRNYNFTAVPLPPNLKCSSAITSRKAVIFHLGLKIRENRSNNRDRAKRRRQTRYYCRGESRQKPKRFLILKSNLVRRVSRSFF